MLPRQKKTLFLHVGGGRKIFRPIFFSSDQPNFHFGPIPPWKNLVITYGSGICFLKYLNSMTQKSISANSEAFGDNCKDWYRKLTLQISMHDLNTKLLHIRVKPFLVSKDQTTTKWVLLKAERQIFWRGFCKSYARFPKLLISFFAQLEASQQNSQVGRKEFKRLATRKSNNIDRNPKKYARKFEPIKYEFLTSSLNPFRPTWL